MLSLYTSREEPTCSIRSLIRKLILVILEVEKLNFIYLRSSLKLAITILSSWTYLLFPDNQISPFPISELRVYPFLYNGDMPVTILSHPCQSPGSAISLNQNTIHIYRPSIIIVTTVGYHKRKKIMYRQRALEPSQQLQLDSLC